jgi:hypothetical protein
MIIELKMLIYFYLGKIQIIEKEISKIQKEI